MIQWDLQTGKLIRRFEGQPDGIWSVAISPDGQYAASSGSAGNILLWDLQTAKPIRSFVGHTGGIHSVKFSADGSQLLSASEDATVILWDVQTGQSIHMFEDSTQQAFSAVFSADNHTILSATQGGVVIWDIKTGQMLQRFRENDGVGIFDAVFSPDGHFVLSAGVSGLVLWNINTGQPSRRLLGQGILNCGVFSSDGRTVLSGGLDHTLRLWGLENGQLIRRFERKGDSAMGLALSPDGHRAIAGWRSALHTDFILLDVSTGAEIRRYTVNEASLQPNVITFSPDGQTALLATHQGVKPTNITPFDLNLGPEITRSKAHPAR